MFIYILALGGPRGPMRHNSDRIVWTRAMTVGSNVDVLGVPTLPQLLTNTDEGTEGHRVMSVPTVLGAVNDVHTTQDEIVIGRRADGENQNQRPYIRRKTKTNKLGH